MSNNKYLDPMMLQLCYLSLQQQQMIEELLDTQKKSTQISKIAAEREAVNKIVRRDLAQDVDSGGTTINFGGFDDNEI